MPTSASGEIGDDDAFEGETHTQTFAGETATVEMDDEETSISQASALQRPAPAAPATPPRPETEYSLPRTGTREVFEERTPPPVPAGGAIGRLRPAMPRAPSGSVPTAPPSAKTVVAGAPRPATAPPVPPPIPTKPPTHRGMPAVEKPPAEFGAADDFQTNPAAQQPTAVVPQPQAYPTSSPAASTLMSASPPPPAAQPSPGTTSKGFGPLLDLEVPPASTAKGFQPPQTYPVTAPQPPPPPPHQMPTMAIQPGMQPRPVAPMPMPVPEAPPVYRAPPVVLDVTPRSLGIATVAGFCEELIRRNSRLPTEMVKLFTTSRDRQDAVRIVVCQGESRRLDNNTVIGDLRLEGIPARPRGETSIEVTFALDASGILQVKARDALTGREQRARLDLVGGVSEQDVAASRERVQQLRR